MSRTVVVGAGISGLATAYLIRRNDPQHEVVVVEAARRLGGKVSTVEVAGLPVDTGPDAFLARSAPLRDLVESLALTPLVVQPESSGAYIWSRGRLRALPPGAAMGLPERLWPLLRSGLLSPTGVVRAGLDLVLPARRVEGDPTVAELVRPRFGAEVYDRLVQPLLGGIHAGDAGQLSARSAVPEVAALVDAGRSIYLTMRSRRPPTPPRGAKRPAVLVSIDGGLGVLVDALAEALPEDALVTGTRVQSVVRRGSGWALTTAEGELQADRVILATPAWASAKLLEAVAPDAAAAMREIPYAGVGNVTFAFRRDQIPTLAEGTGVLVPPVEGELIVAIAFLSRKWRHSGSDRLVLVKAMVGRHGDRRWESLPHDRLIAETSDGLARILGIRAQPVDVFVQRWPAAMPQYVVGHAERLARIDAALAAHPGLHVTGAAYRGVGLAGCVAQAAQLAAHLRAQ